MNYSTQQYLRPAMLEAGMLSWRRLSVCLCICPRKISKTTGHKLAEIMCLREHQK